MRSQAHPLRNGVAAVAVVALMAGTLGVLTEMTTRDAAHAAMNHGMHHGATTHGKHHGVTRSRKAIEFRNDMRKLWEDHITWTRMFIVSDVAELPDRDTAAARLLANQDDIGDAIKPFYGEEAGEHLSALLRDHILIAADILDAAERGDSAGVEEANARWHANADEIADFLSAANPKNWADSEMREMMSEHLDWTLNEAVARLNQDWDADVKAYDHIHDDILHMADMLSLGIIKQFPSKF